MSDPSKDQESLGKDEHVNYYASSVATLSIMFVLNMDKSKQWQSSIETELYLAKIVTHMKIYKLELNKNNIYLYNDA